jgi:hypothetical protein
MEVYLQPRFNTASGNMCPLHKALRLTFALSATAAPSAKLRRNTRLEAERARNNATINVLTAADTLAEITGQVVCGANSLTPTNFNVHCRIVATFPNGGSGSCSAAKVGNNRLATAGHCVYDKPAVSAHEQVGGGYGSPACQTWTLLSAYFSPAFLHGHCCFPKDPTKVKERLRSWHSRSYT